MLSGIKETEKDTVNQTMNHTNLPGPFLENIRRLLGEESDSFLASFDGDRKNALRVNLLKLTPQQFEAAAPFRVERVPWTQNGYYVDYREKPGQHPWYRAGLYYLQEPSAMAPAQILPVKPGDRVLDLCAAPGGKATELGARLDGRGILVANEISSSRVRALEHNIELFGIRNGVVTNESPSRLADRFPEFFDCVLVDAPCSGEGMFRKMPEAAKAWYPEKVEECARVQREIILQAADMLRPGGYMVYSTCTFEPAENELVIAHLLRQRPDMELMEISCTEGRESFSKAFPLEELYEKGYRLPEDVRRDPDFTKAVRIWPHRAEGEGHFIALLRKQTQSGIFTERTFDICGTDERAEGSRKKTGRQKKAFSGKTPHGRFEEGGIPKQERMLLEQFLETYDTDRNIDINRCEIRSGHVYLMPEDCPKLQGLRFLRAGLYLGELKKNRFEPSQELALSLPAAKQMDRGQITDDGIHIMIPSGDEKLDAFLKGEAIRLEEAGPSGWRLVCADSWPAGWGKMTGGVLKNHIPAGWRRV